MCFQSPPCYPHSRRASSYTEVSVQVPLRVRGLHQRLAAVPEPACGPEPPRGHCQEEERAPEQRSHRGLAEGRSRPCH